MKSLNKNVVKTQRNYREYKRNYVTLNPKSDTVPDQTLSVRQIIDRFASGRGSDIGQKEPSYLGTNITIEDDLLLGVDFNTLDHVEKKEFIEDLGKRMQENTTRRKKAKEEADKLRIDAEIKKDNERYEKFKKQLEDEKKAE